MESSQLVESKIGSATPLGRYIERREASSGDVVNCRHLVSAADKKVEQTYFSKRLLINNSGPKILPCGTPDK